MGTRTIEPQGCYGVISPFGEWLIANGVDLETVLCSHVDVTDDLLSYTYFKAASEPGDSSFVKERRTVPLLVPPEDFGL